MVERKRLGLIYNYDEGWIAGAYYILNIIKAINILDDSQKPEITIFSPVISDFINLKTQTNYPYLRYHSSRPKLTLVERIINKFCRIIFRQNLINKRPKDNSVDVLYPNPNTFFYDKISNKKKIYWIPDFQDRYLKDFFSDEEIMSRKKNQEWIAQNANRIIFSSYDALNDFENFFPDSNSNKNVVQFAVTNDQELEEESMNEILSRYGILGEFYICSNQFWIHKNHKTVIYAVKEIIEDGGKIMVVLTGKDNDYRFPDYPKKIKDLIYKLKVQEYVKYLGFIPKLHVEALIRSSKAVIQPSLFEGWSTLIEDAKSLNKFIIASDIQVHIEQLNNYPNKCFFSKLNPSSLKEVIIDNDQINICNFDYQKEVISFANKFVGII